MAITMDDEIKMVNPGDGVYCPGCGYLHLYLPGIHHCIREVGFREVKNDEQHRTRTFKMILKCGNCNATFYLEESSDPKYRDESVLFDVINRATGKLEREITDSIMSIDELRKIFDDREWD